MGNDCEDISKMLEQPICKELLNFLPEIIFIVDKERKMLWVNQYGLDVFGYTLDEIVGQHINLFIHHSFQKHMEERARKVIDDGVIPKRERVKLVKKNGSLFWGLIHSKQLCNEEGESLGAIGGVQDLTKYIELELELQKKKEMKGLKYLARNFK